nr:MAG: hypothetical protein [Bacteriophage sp.]
MKVRYFMSYNLNYSGEQVNTAIGNALPLISGTETITNSSSSSFLNTKLSLPFTPTINTRIVATLRRAGTPSPFLNYCLTLTYNQTSATNASIYAVICAGQNASGTPESTLPAGTYYVDWLVLDKGDSVSTSTTGDDT